MQSHQTTDSEFINREFGKKISYYREHVLGITQSDLALALGDELGKPVNTSTINRIEKGTRPTPVNEVYALAKILRQSPQDLLPSANLADELLSPVLGAIHQNTRSLIMNRHKRDSLKDQQRSLEETKDAATLILKTLSEEAKPTIKELKKALSIYTDYIRNSHTPFSSIRDLEHYFDLPASRIEMIDKYQERNMRDGFNYELRIADMLGDGLAQKFGLSNAES